MPRTLRARCLPAATGCDLSSACRGVRRNPSSVLPCPSRAPPRSATTPRRCTTAASTPDGETFRSSLASGSASTSGECSSLGARLGRISGARGISRVRARPSRGRDAVRLRSAAGALREAATARARQHHVACLGDHRPRPPVIVPRTTFAYLTDVHLGSMVSSDPLNVARRGGGWIARVEGAKRSHSREGGLRDESWC